MVGMGVEDRAGHDYTATWCTGGEIGNVVLNGGDASDTCASASAHRWS